MDSDDLSIQSPPYPLVSVIRSEQTGVHRTEYEIMLATGPRGAMQQLLATTDGRWVDDALQVLELFAQEVRRRATA